VPSEVFQRCPDVVEFRAIDNQEAVVEYACRLYGQRRILLVELCDGRSGYRRLCDCRYRDGRAAALVREKRVGTPRNARFTGISAMSTTRMTSESGSSPANGWFRADSEIVAASLFYMSAKSFPFIVNFWRLMPVYLTILTQ